MHRDQLIEMLEPTVKSLGYELADLELQIGGTAGLLRLYIDHLVVEQPDTEKVDAELPSEKIIGIEDCEIVSRQVSALLDVEDPLPGDYNLEVSSPGLSRRLVKEQHFMRFIGSNVKVKLKRLLDDRRNFKAVLIGFEDNNVLLKEGESEFSIPLQEIDTARVVPKF
ncbi:MAG: ribosome maturation factor RimP [Gammaproteobacteria bacterium]|nr:ribosome maturation factor RimP [Gammaproteobacteria bacterium]MCP4090024.1 ribosome maturation factor RimP [Gammaproteobacteria bacterium]MCP4277757.1 ribosome maturation factor RimP [Gammaproteobacteria bacterium]MCP4832220.1 ribosome maturation factor RimP [Gammaproteobacteria bacterium]MCP4929287.1 ribosome maturation factor RimP [Gammaproteobacteria bacterium]